MRSKRLARADRRGCVACGSCVLVCPRQAITVVKGCYAQVNEDLCVGCGKCGKTCPAGCIALEERGSGER